MKGHARSFDIARMIVNFRLKPSKEIQHAIFKYSPIRYLS